MMMFDSYGTNYQLNLCLHGGNPRQSLSKSEVLETRTPNRSTVRKISIWVP